MTRKLFSLFAGLIFLIGVFGFPRTVPQKPGGALAGRFPGTGGRTPALAPAEQVSERYPGGFAKPNTPMNFWIREISYSSPDGDLSNNTFVAQVTIPTLPYMYFPIIFHSSSFGE